jgi:Holliday junction resolvase RusA-like endonuclease
MTFFINLPVPPSTNNLFINVASRGRVKSKEYKAWITEAGLMLNVQRPKPIRGKVAIDIKVPVNNRRDLSNHLKAIEDLLVGMSLIDDDRHIVDIHMAWHNSPDAIVSVSEA